MTPAFSVRLLGDLSICHGEHSPLSVASSKAQSLLLFLFLHRAAPQSRQHLAFLLWPDSDEPQALTNLRNLLFKLRQSLPFYDDLLQVDRSALRIHPQAHLELDLDRLNALYPLELSEEVLEEALRLYAGPLVPGCYEEWAVEARDKIQMQFQAFLEQAAAQFEARRQYTAALAAARRGLELEPTHEELCLRLMRLLAFTRDRAGALKVYRACATALSKDLQTEPSQALKELHRQLMRKEHQGEGTLAEPLPLVAREKEWQVLGQRWNVASRGSLEVVILKGEAGIGKTRLAEELCAFVARQGGQVLFARCFGAEGQLAFAPVVTLLRACPLSRLSPAWLQPLVHLLPELLESHPRLEAPPAPMEPWQRHQLLEAAARAVLLTQPTLLVIDDLHWCDRDSEAWLHFLARYAPSAPLLMLLTLRPEELSLAHQTSHLADALGDTTRLTVLNLERLLEAETGLLAEGLLGHALTPAELHRLHLGTDGNPLFVVELVRGGVFVEKGTRTLPTSLEAVFERRVSRLSGGARRMLELAAIVGQGMDSQLLLEAVKLELGEALEALEELYRQKLLIERDDGYFDFSHALLHDFVIGRLGTARQRLLHLQVGRVMAAQPPRVRETLAGQAAHHLERAGAPGEALPLYAEAGDMARRAFAQAEALRLYQAALDLPVEGTPETRWRILRGQAEVHAMGGDAPALEAVLEKMEALIGLEPHPGWRARVYNHRAQLAFNQWRLTDCLTWADRAIEQSHLAGEGDHEIALWAAHVRTRARLARDSGWPQAVTEADENLRQARTLGNPHLLLNILSFKGAAMVATPHHHLGSAESLSTLEEGLVLARHLGDRRSEGYVLENQSVAFRRLGRLEDAVQALRVALELSRQIGNEVGKTRCLSMLNMVCAWRGDFASSLQYGLEGASLSRKQGHNWNAFRCFHTLSTVYAHLGRRDVASDWADLAIALLETLEVGTFAAEIRCVMAADLCAMGRGQEALAWVETWLPQLPNTCTEGDLGRNLVCAGRVFASEGRWDKALECFHRAIPLVQNATYPFPGQTALDASAFLGRTLLTMGQLANALAELRRVSHRAGSMEDTLPCVLNLRAALALALEANGCPEEARGLARQVAHSLRQVASHLPEEADRRAFLGRLAELHALLR